MEKLSSILPKSPRTQKVDNSRAQPARPGAPLLGRPMGRVTQKVVFEDTPVETMVKPELDLSFADKFSSGLPADKVSLSENNLDEPKLSNYTRKGDLQKVKIAEDVSRKFANLDVAPKSESIPAMTESIDDSAADVTLEAS